MTDDQKEFWQDVVMHVLLAAVVAVAALPYLHDIPGWLSVIAVVVGTTGGFFAASHAWTLHRIHRPSLARGLTEFLCIGLLGYAVLREISLLGANITHAAAVGILVGFPVWLTAYAVYMVVEAFAAGERQTQRN